MRKAAKVSIAAMIQPISVNQSGGAHVFLTATRASNWLRPTWSRPLSLPLEHLITLYVARDIYPCSQLYFFVHVKTTR